MMRYPQEIFLSQLELFKRINESGRPIPNYSSYDTPNKNNPSDYFQFPLQLYPLCEFRIANNVRYGLKNFHTTEEDNLTRFVIDFIIAAHKHSLPVFYTSFRPEKDRFVTLSCNREDQKVFMRCLMASF